MKLSLGWIFDHLLQPVSSVDVVALVAKFNTMTAEIEGFHVIEFDRSSFDIFKCVEVSSDKTTFKNSKNEKVSLATRTDVKQNDFCLVVNENGNYRYATLADFGHDRDSYFSVLYLTDEEFSLQSWRNHLPEKDVIFDVDNKSVTHRPDMWGHRGFAREFAMILDFDLIAQDAATKKIAINRSNDSAACSIEGFRFSNLAPNVCNSFSLVKFENMKNCASLPAIAFRLAIVGQKPINALVDLTNYLMLDWGQPVHLYDLDKLKNNELNVRFAKNGEKAVLLDGLTYELTDKDLVIADKNEIFGLAGIKGSLDHGVSATSKNFLLEVANFDAATIRRSAQRHHIRTDASARFEKTLDPYQLVSTQERFLFLVDKLGISCHKNSEISLFENKPCSPVIVDICHSDLERKINIKISQHEVEKIFRKLEFACHSSPVENDVCYQVTVPSFRSSKDVLADYDIVEEVARCHGFDKVESRLPVVARRFYDLTKTMQLRNLKRTLSYGQGFVEQYNYIFYDEMFVSNLGFDSAGCLEVVNPVSQNQRRLIQTLFWGLFKNVVDNVKFDSELRFYELAKIWPQEKEEYLENKVLGGLLFFKNGKQNLFEFGADVVCRSANVFGVNNLKFEKSNIPFLFANKNQTANLVVDNTVVGYCCSVDLELLIKAGFESDAEAFYFELNVEMIGKRFGEKIFKPFSVMQSSYVDVSILVPFSTTADSLKNSLRDLSDLVLDVSIVDWFESDKWQSARSVTYRLSLCHADRSIDKQDIDAALAAVYEFAKNKSLTIRE